MRTEERDTYLQLFVMLPVCCCATQAWLAVYQLLLNPECQRKYQFNMSNKNRLLKVWWGGKEGVV